MGVSAVFNPEHVTFKVESSSHGSDRMRGHAQAWAEITSPAEAKDLAEKLWSWAQTKEENRG